MMVQESFIPHIITDVFVLFCFVLFCFCCCCYYCFYVFVCFQDTNISDFFFFLNNRLLLFIYNYCIVKILLAFVCCDTQGYNDPNTLLFGTPSASLTQIQMAAPWGWGYTYFPTPSFPPNNSNMLQSEDI